MILARAPVGPSYATALSAPLSRVVFQRRADGGRKDLGSSWESSTSQARDLHHGQQQKLGLQTLVEFTLLLRLLVIMDKKNTG